MQAIRTARTLLILGLPLGALLAVSQPKVPVETAPPPAEPSADAADSAGIARIQRHIAEREYQASANAEGLQAPNRAQNLRSYFDATGVRVHDRTAAGEPRLVGLSLAAIGRGEALTEAAPGDVAHDGARVEIRRPGLVEWYVNQEAGLEQGFTLDKRSAGDGPLVLELAVEGAEARAQGEDVVFATGAGRKLSFAKLAAKDANGRDLAARFEVASADRLRYVIDDAGAAYPVVIDPLLTGTAPDTRLEDSFQNSWFGSSVATGDVNGDGYADVIAGAPLYDAGDFDEGAVFIFHGGASGIAAADVTQATTQLESNQALAQFGVGVANAGDVNGDGIDDVIVGASFYSAGHTQEGAAFVFHGVATGIPDGDPSTAATQLESNQSLVHLGASVAGAGDVNGDGLSDVIVGAPDYDSGEGDEGVALVFHGSAPAIPDGGPSSAATLLESNQTSARFGASVASAGDTNGDGYTDVFVGAPLYDAGQGDEGAAFVFMGSAAGVPDGAPPGAAQFESNQAGAHLGASVAGAGDVNGDGYADVIVGAPGHDHALPPLTSSSLPDLGVAVIFHGSALGPQAGTLATADTLLEGGHITPCSPFGCLYAPSGLSVASAGDVDGDGYADVIVGAGGVPPAFPNDSPGGAYVFLGGLSGVPDGRFGPFLTDNSADATLILNAGGDRAGASVAAGDLNGDGYSDVIVGAPSPAFLYDVGTVHVYQGGAEGLRDGNPASAAIEIESGLTSGWLGASVAAAGDVNGDGYSDVIVGAPRYDSGETDEGAAFILHGSATAALIVGNQIDGDQALAHFGESVAGAGDVNGDGYADVIVGAPDYANGESREGGAFVFHGTALGIWNNTASGASTRLEGNQPVALFGSSVAGAGDVNGDGVGDVIVGASHYDAGEADEGAAFVFHGAAVTGIPHGSPTTAATQLESNRVAAGLSVVAGAGDVNGDGYADVIVGAPAWSNGEIETQEGAAFVFHGAVGGIPDGNPSTAPTRIESIQEFGLLGSSVAGAGDVNGDGRADIIVGAETYEIGQTYEGAAFVYHGNSPAIPHGSPSTAATRLESNQPDAWFGTGVAGVGDVNGDGFADVMVGARGYDNGEADEGAAFVFHGSSSGIPNGDPATAAAQLESNQAGALFGEALAGAGDVNGDGYADVIVGASFYDDGQTDEGAAFVFLGNGDGDGRPVLARQVRPSNGLPVVPWTRAEATYRTQLTATHPAGRGRVKIQLEHCPAGVAFGNAACTLSTPVAWTDVSAATGPVTLTRDLGGLPSNTLRRWRARVLYSPTTGASPANPAHGPWRRFHALAVEADFRTASVGGGGGGGCGIGPELALLVPALLGLRRARRHASEPS